MLRGVFPRAVDGLLVLGFFFSSHGLPTTWSKADPCSFEALTTREVTGRFRGRTYPITELDVTGVPKTPDDMLLVTDLPGRVVVWVKPGEGHLELFVDNIRIVGDPFASIRTPMRSHSLPHGYFFALDGIGDEQIDAFKSQVEKFRDRMALSCAHAACIVMRDGLGVRGFSDRFPTMFSFQLLGKLLRGELQNSQGEPLQVNIYRTQGSESLLAKMIWSLNTDVSKVAEGIQYGSYVVGAPAVIVYVVYLLATGQ